MVSAGVTTAGSPVRRHVHSVGLAGVAMKSPPVGRAIGVARTPEERPSYKVIKRTGRARETLTVL